MTFEPTEARATQACSCSRFLHSISAKRSRAMLKPSAPNSLEIARATLFTEATSDGGFVVHKPAPVAVSLSVTPNLATVTMVCHYRFTLANGLPPREDRFNVVIASDGGETLHLKHHGTGQVFPNADALSEFLLVPVLTGRPR